MPVMAKKKKPKAEGEAAKPSRRGKALHLWIDPALRELLESLAERNRRTITVEVTIALEERFRRLGLLPPQAETQPPVD